MGDENGQLLPSHCSYFDKELTEMFLECSSTKHIILFKFLILIDCHGNQKAKYAKQKSTSQKPYGG